MMATDEPGWTRIKNCSLLRLRVSPARDRRLRSVASKDFRPARRYSTSGIRFDEPSTLATGHRRGTAERARMETRNAGRQIRFPAARPDSEISNPGDSPAARSVCPEPGIQPVQLFAVLRHCQPVERGAAFVY